MECFGQRLLESSVFELLVSNDQGLRRKLALESICALHDLNGFSGQLVTLEDDALDRCACQKACIMGFDDERNTFYINQL